MSIRSTELLEAPACPARMKFRREASDLEEQKILLEASYARRPSD